MKITQLNMISWIFYIHLITLSFIASILAINGWDDGQMSSIGEGARLYGWLAIQYTMIAMPLGMLFINYLYGYKSNSRLFLSYINSPVITLTSPKDSFVLYPLYVFSLISLLAVVYSLILLKNIPSFAVIQGLDAYSLAVLRVEAAQTFEGSYSVRHLFGVTLTPILSYVAYTYWRMTKLREHFIWFLIMFVFSFFILTYDINKAPFVLFIMGFLFLHILIKGCVKKTSLCWWGGVMLVLIISAHILVMRIDDFEILYTFLWRRIILGEAQGTFMSFEHFPNTHEFIGLSSLSSRLSLVFGMDVSERAAKILMDILIPKGITDDTAGVMNSLFIQEAWANFGLYGVLIAPIYVGMFIQIIYNYFLKSKKTPIALGTLTYLSYKMPISSGLNHFIFDDAIVFIFIFFISVYVAALFSKSFKRNGPINAQELKI